MNHQHKVTIDKAKLHQSTKTATGTPTQIPDYHVQAKSTNLHKFCANLQGHCKEKIQRTRHCQIHHHLSNIKLQQL